MLDVIEKYSSDLNAAYDLDREMGQFQYLIELGKNSISLKDEQKTDQNKMFGCLAQVWIIHRKEGNKYFFQGDSDAFIVKGIVNIVTEIMSGCTSEEINIIDHTSVHKIGFGPGLTARRQVGMMSMIDFIKKIQ